MVRFSHFVFFACFGEPVILHGPYQLHQPPRQYRLYRQKAPSLVGLCVGFSVKTTTQPQIYCVILRFCVSQGAESRADSGASGAANASAGSSGGAGGDKKSSGAPSKGGKAGGDKSGDGDDDDDSDDDEEEDGDGLDSWDLSLSEFGDSREDGGFGAAFTDDDEEVRLCLQ